jgi:hypothetical protein
MMAADFFVFSVPVYWRPVIKPVNLLDHAT